jgi:hypothetical protein
VEVRTPQIQCSGDYTIGRFLQQAGTVLIGEAAPAGGLPVTITSNSAGSLQVAGSDTAAGATSVTVTIPQGQTSAVFFLHGLAASGTPTFSCSAPGYPSNSGQVILMPSGVVIAGLFLGYPHRVSLASGPSSLTLSTAILNPADNTFGVKQPLAGGLSVSVSLTNSKPSVGTVSATPVTLLGGTENTLTPFTPLVANDQTTITAVPPLNFTQPSNYGSVLVQVEP